MFLRRFWFHGLYRGGGKFSRSLILVSGAAVLVLASCWWLEFPNKLKPLDAPKAILEQAVEQNSPAHETDAKQQDLDDFHKLHPGLRSESVTEAVQSISILFSIAAIGFASLLLAWWWFYEPSSAQTSFVETKVVRKKGLVITPRASAAKPVRFKVDSPDS